MKKLISVISTFLILIICNFALCNIFKTSFFEFSFLTGVLVTIFIAFFSSNGGATTSACDMRYKFLIESKERKNNGDIEFNINLPFIVSLIYTIITGMISFIVYFDHFF